MHRHIGVSLLVSAALLLTFAGGASATSQEPSAPPMRSVANPSSPQTALGTAFTYQGQLRNNGNPVNANCDFQFALYDAVSGGNQIGTTQAASNIRVSNGLFTVSLDFGNVFTGDARWLDIAVRCPTGSGTYTPLAPRQPLTAVPYALGLQPGARIVSPDIGLLIDGANDGLRVSSVGAGQSAIWAHHDGNSVGHGLFATVANGTGVVGISAGGGPDVSASNLTGTGVYGRSDLAGSCIIDAGCTPAGIGVYGENNLDYGRGVQGRADGLSGIGVQGGADGSNGIGVQGEADGSSGSGVSGNSTAGTGVSGGSGTGYGVSGQSGNVGVYAHNTNTNGPTVYLASGCCAGDFYGNVYVHGNLTVSGSKTGYVVDLAVNAGSDALSAGDVVAVIGSTTPVVGTIPLARVVKASMAYQTGVIGVVDQHVVRDAGLTSKDEPVAPGEYVNIVTLGMFRTIKVDAGFGAIHTGDLLVASPHAGYAMTATDHAQAVGAVIGKALGNLATGTGTLPVIVTLQ